MDDRLTKLKEAAEKAIDESSQRSDDVPLTDFNRIIHHLKLYLTELEFQNKELQQTQNQLKNSESRYAQLYNQAPVGYVTLNSNSIIVQANQTFADMVNTDSSQILNSSLSDFMSDSDRAYFHTHFQAFFSNPADKSMELKMFKRDGAHFFARITGNLKSNDSSETDKYKQPKLFLIISDITKQKIAEDLLIEREYSYRTLADSGQALIWSSDTNKQYNYFNNVWLNFTGRSLDMELGNGWMDGIHPDDFQYCTKTYQSHFDKQESFNMEYRLRNSTGEYRWILDKATPNYNAKGEFIMESCEPYQ